MMTRIREPVMVLAALLLGATSAVAFEIPSSVVGSAGGMATAATNLVLFSTLGEAGIGLASGATSQVGLGWWARGGIGYTTPVLVSLVSTELSPDAVKVTWHSVGLAGRVTVQRRTADDPWSAIGEAEPDGTGQIFYEDRTVSPGVRYAYRLGVGGGTQEFFSPEVWVDVPRSLALALRPVRPNPVRGDFVVPFTLPGRDPASVAVVDVTGRRVASEDVGDLGAGDHELAVRGLRPGVYMVRLTQGASVLVRRMVVLD